MTYQLEFELVSDRLQMDEWRGKLTSLVTKEGLIITPVTYECTVLFPPLGKLTETMLVLRTDPYSRSG